MAGLDSMRSGQLVVLMKPEAGLRVAGLSLASVANASTVTLETQLRSLGARLRPMFGPSEDRVALQVKAVHTAARARATVEPRELTELARFYQVEAPAASLEAAAVALRQHPLVEAAYVKPPAGLPSWPEPRKGGAGALPDTPNATTPNYSTRQGYLDAAPGGIDARAAWALAGGRGKGVRVIDCEWGWRLTHEDLTENQGGVVAGTSINADTTDGDELAALNHGTAVFGEISGDRNGVGVTGIAPDAIISASSFTDQSSSKAIKAAADKLKAGDIILLEIHAPGPNAPEPYAANDGQLGYIAIEFWPDDYAAIQYAVQKGIIVVEAAGNGAENLDDPSYDARPAGFPASWKNPFNPKNPSSGAVLVGAGACPPGTHGRNHGADRSRLGFSNYGARVDAQGWGREVTTTGYGDLQGGDDRDLWYTDVFAGTSSASPIVVGALAATQGVLKARGHRPLDSERARRFLRLTGSPQQDEPGRPASQRIGKRPNLRELIPAAAGFASRSADVDGDGRAEIVVTSPWGLGILKQSGALLDALMLAPNGTRLGGWLLNTADNQFGPVGDLDGDGKAEIVVTSPWGLGVLELSSATLAAPVLAANGTRFGGWLLNTADNAVLAAADFNGDGKAELLISSPWGLGVLQQSGGTFTAPMMAPNGTHVGGWVLNTADNHFGPIGDFDGDGRAEILVTSPWGLGVLKLAGSTMTVVAMVANGTRIGGWLLNTADNHFGPVGDFDGDGKIEILITSPWGVGLLKLNGGALSIVTMAANGTRLGGWLLNTGDNHFGPAGDFDGDRAAEVLVTSPWGAGLLKLVGGAFTATVMARNGVRLGGWLLNTANDRLGTSRDFDGDGRAELLISSPWGLGVLELAGASFASPVMAANGTRFGGWLLNTADNDLGHGD